MLSEVPGNPHGTLFGLGSDTVVLRLLLRTAARNDAEDVLENVETDASVRFRDKPSELLTCTALPRYRADMIHDST